MNARTPLVGLALTVFLSGCQSAAPGSAAGPATAGDPAAFAALPDGRVLDARGNVFTSSTQAAAALDLDDRGNSLLVWDSRRQQAGRYGVYARLLDPAGNPLTDEIRVNLHTLGHQMNPAVGVGGGNAWIAWTSVGQDGSAGTVVARRFAAGLDHADASPEILVNETVAGHQADPSVAVNDRGEALVLWTGPRAETSDAERAPERGIFGRVFASDGTPLTPELALGTGEEHETLPQAAAAPDGSFVLVWARASRGSEEAFRSTILARRLAADGSAASNIVPVARTLGVHVEPAVAVAPDGRVAATWMTREGDDLAVAVRFFDADLTPAAAERVVARVPEGATGVWLSAASVAARPDGGFVLAWNRHDPAAERDAILAARFDAEGRPEGTPFRATRRDEGSQRLAAADNAARLAVAPDGRIALAWSGDAGLGDDSAAHVSFVRPASITLAPGSDRAPDAPLARALAMASPADAAIDVVAPIPPERFPMVDLPLVTGGPSGPDFGFLGINFTGWSPPDPEIAAGPNHLVAVTNGAIAFFDKDGSLLFQDEIEDSFGFWGGQGATGFVFDPECLWDPHAQRYFAMACERGSNGRSYYLIAVSDDANPVGAWHKYRIDVTNVDTDIDSPNMAVDDEVLYLSADFFNPDKYQVLMIEKAPLLAGGPVNSDELLITGSGNQSMGLPVVHDENLGVGYLLQSSEGTNNGVGFNEVRIHGITNQLNNPQRVTVDVNVPVYDYPNQPPQQGTSNRPFLFEPRFWSCVVRNGSLWAVHHVNSSRARVRWYEFNLNGWPLSGNDPTLAQWGELDYGSGVHTYFPSIAVDEDDNATIVFARSSSQEFISIGRAFRRASDPLGEFRPMEFVKESTAPYTQANRWGDYSGAEADPAQPGSFWIFHEWTDTPSAWRTWVARVDTQPETNLLTPDDFTVLFGTVISGDVDDLAASDDAHLRTRSRPGFLAAEPNLLRARFDFTVPGSPQTLDLAVESRLNTPGGTATLEARNWNTNGHTLLGTHPLTTSDQVQTFNGLDADAFVRPSDGRFELRVKHVVIAAFSAQGFDSFFDHLQLAAE